MKQWVFGVLSFFLLPISLEAAVNVRIGGDSYSLEPVKCGIDGASFWVVGGDYRNKENGFLDLYLQNHRSVVENSSKEILTFRLDKPGVGRFEFTGKGGKTWEVYSMDGADAHCDVETPRVLPKKGERVEITLQCYDLSLNAALGGRRPFPSERKESLATLTIDGKLSCEIASE